MIQQSMSLRCEPSSEWPRSCGSGRALQNGESHRVLALIRFGWGPNGPSCEQIGIQLHINMFPDWEGLVTSAKKSSTSILCSTRFSGLMTSIVWIRSVDGRALPAWISSPHTQIIPARVREPFIASYTMFGEDLYS